MDLEKFKKRNENKHKLADLKSMTPIQVKYFENLGVVTCEKLYGYYVTNIPVVLDLLNNLSKPNFNAELVIREIEEVLGPVEVLNYIREAQKPKPGMGLHIDDIS